MEERNRLTIDQLDILPFEKITPAFLSAYEQWMLRFGKRNLKQDGIRLPASVTTLGIYLRHIRAAYKQAIADKLVPEDWYPFGEK